MIRLRVFRDSAQIFVVSLAAMIGCRLGGEPAEPGTSSKVQARQMARRPNLPVILVLMPASPAAEAVLSGIVDELVDDYDVLARTVDDRTSPREIDAHMQELRPAALVLMNNPTVRLYRRYQAMKTGRRDFPPAVVALASFLEQTSTGITNTTGIVYEIPVITSLVNLRSLLKQPVRKVGVIHRPQFAGFVEAQRRLAEVEKFELVAEVVEEGSAADVRQALDRLGRAKVDALWVINDNVLLDREAVVRAWLPSLKRMPLPVIVNVGSLVSNRFDFGTFAVLPDHRALGVQTANLLLEIAEDGWRVTDRKLEYPLSVETVLAIDLARRNLRLDEAEVARIDRTIR